MVSEEEIMCGCDKLMGGAVPPLSKPCSCVLGLHIWYSSRQAILPLFLPLFPKERLQLYICFLRTGSAATRGTWWEHPEAMWDDCSLPGNDSTRQAMFVWQPMTGAWLSQMSCCSVRAGSRAAFWHFPQATARLLNRWLSRLCPCVTCQARFCVFSHVQAQRKGKAINIIFVTKDNGIRWLTPLVPQRQNCQQLPNWQVLSYRMASVLGTMR